MLFCIELYRTASFVAVDSLNACILQSLLKGFLRVGTFNQNPTTSKMECSFCRTFVHATQVRLLSRKGLGQFWMFFHIPLQPSVLLNLLGQFGIKLHQRFLRPLSLWPKWNSFSKRHRLGLTNQYCDHTINKTPMELHSSAFTHNGMIPRKYSQHGEDINPPLE